MDKNELRILSNVLCDKDGLEFVLLLLKQFGAFERGLNLSLSDKEILRTLVKREAGVWLLDNIYQANPDKYMEILKKEKGLQNG